VRGTEAHVPSKARTEEGGGAKLCNLSHNAAGLVYMTIVQILVFCRLRQSVSKGNRKRPSGQNSIALNNGCIVFHGICRIPTSLRADSPLYLDFLSSLPLLSLLFFFFFFSLSRSVTPFLSLRNDGFMFEICI
jgi:hypothetical protein